MDVKAGAGIERDAKGEAFSIPYGGVHSWYGAYTDKEECFALPPKRLNEVGCVLLSCAVVVCMEVCGGVMCGWVFVCVRCFVRCVCEKGRANTHYSNTCDYDSCLSGGGAEDYGAEQDDGAAGYAAVDPQ